VDSYKLRLGWVDLVSKDVLLVGLGNCFIQTGQQLKEALAFAADQHGQALVFVAGGGDAAYGTLLSNCDVTIGNQLRDIGQSLGIAGRGCAVGVLLYASGPITDCRLTLMLHGSSSSMLKPVFGEFDFPTVQLDEMECQVIKGGPDLVNRFTAEKGDGVGRLFADINFQGYRLDTR
jgi:hypothetical protein